MLHGSTLWELMERRVDSTPDALMVVDEDMRTMTFADFWSEAELAAAGLAAQGVVAGDHVSWQLPTWIESLVLAAALARLGVHQNPVLTIARRRELAFIAEQFSPSLFVTPSVFRGFDHEELAVSVARGHGDMRVLVVDKALPQGDPSTLELPRLDGFDEAGTESLPSEWVFYTSGTTGEPKGVRHTDATIAAAARAMAQRLELIARDRNSLVFPVTHVGGMVWMFASLMSGCANILTESFDPQRTVEVLSREGVTLAGSGTYFHQCYIEQQRSSLRPIFPDVRAFPGGGAPKPITLAEEIRMFFEVPVLSGYGMTEAPIVTMASLSDSAAELATTEGKPTSGVEVRIADGDGNEVAPGDEGEILLKAPQLMVGYTDPSLDTDALDDEGYLRTGDLGWIDPSGNLVVTGRIKDVIVRKGENVSAKELEDLLVTHIGIAEAAVIGLPDPDSGERVCAVIELRDPASPVPFDEVSRYLVDLGLMRQKLPEQLEVVETLPRNSAGKVLKHLLRDEYKG